MADFTWESSYHGSRLKTLFLCLVHSKRLERDLDHLFWSVSLLTTFEVLE